MSRLGAVRFGLAALALVAAAWLLLPLLRGSRPAAPRDGGARLRYRLDVGVGPTPSRDGDRALVERSFVVVAARLAEASVVGVARRPADGAVLDLDVPAGIDPERVRQVIASIPVGAGPGSVELRVEVRPTYPHFEDPDGRAVRTDVWAGARSSGAAPEAFAATRDGFDAFKAREAARWVAARAAGERYQPLDPRYALVPVRRAASAPPPAGPDDFVVVEVPARAAERFGGEIFEHVHATVDVRGQPAVALDVKPEFVGAFRAWTEGCIGLPLALVVDGTLEMAPVVAAALSDNLVINLGGSEPHDRAALLERQRQLVARLVGDAPGTLPVPLREEPSAGAR